jgi:hypothetical protein
VFGHDFMPILPKSGRLVVKLNDDAIHTRILDPNLGTNSKSLSVTHEHASVEPWSNAASSTERFGVTAILPSI